MANDTHRRRFLRLATRGSAWAAALVAGVLPELGARAAGLAAQPTTVDTGQTPSAPPPLDGTLQATLYTRALGDPEVSALLATLPEAARIDPPSQSAVVPFDDHGSTQQVIMPVTGYASGATLAYLVYGSARGMVYNGNELPVAIKTLLTSTGKALFAVAGVVQDASTVDPMPALFAYFFPTQYVERQSAGMRPTSAKRGLQRGFMRKVMMATTDDDRGRCYNVAKRSYDTCLRNANSAWYAALAAIGVAIACIAFGLLVIGTTGGAALSFAYFCGVAAGTAAGLVIKYKYDIAACQTLFEGAIELCRRQYPIST